ncbi:MAG: hypothetical protein RLY18_1571 [Pseudomonadota bacterium]
MSDSVNVVMGSAYLYVKAFHILFVASWFAGLFYLPRIYVNMAQETNPQVLERLLAMSYRLYRFMTILMIPAVALGLILWLYYGVGKGPGSGWISIYKKFKAGINKRSHVWYRWFNEVPVVIFLIVSILVVVKPF